MTSASWVPSTAWPISSLKYGKCQLPTPGLTTPSSAVNRLAVIVAIGYSLSAVLLRSGSYDRAGARNSSSQNGAQDRLGGRSRIRCSAGDRGRRWSATPLPRRRAEPDHPGQPRGHPARGLRSDNLADDQAVAVNPSRAGPVPRATSTLRPRTRSLPAVSARSQSQRLTPPPAGSPPDPAACDVLEDQRRERQARQGRRPPAGRGVHHPPPPTRSAHARSGPTRSRTRRWEGSPPSRLRARKSPADPH